MSDTRLSVTKLAGFGMGLFAVQTFWGFTWTTLPLYLKEIANSNIVTGIILSTAGATGMILPVLSGSISDRINTPLGRRKPFIVGGWLLACTMVLLLLKVNTIAMALPLVILAYAGFFTSIGPYFALLPDTVPHTQRSIASGIMFFVGGLGMLSYLFFAARLWDVSHSRPFYWAVIAVILATAVMCLSVHEPEEHAAEEHSGNVLVAALRHRNTAFFLSGMILWWIGIWIVSAFFVITCKALFQVSTALAVKAFFILNASFVLFALPAGLMAAKFGVKQVTMLGLLLLVISFLTVPFIPSYTVVLPCMVMAGAGYGIMLAVSYPMFLKIVPPGKTAGYVGLYMGAQNGTLLVGPAVGGFLIDYYGYTTHFVGAALCILGGMILLGAVRMPEEVPAVVPQPDLREMN